MDFFFSLYFLYLLSVVRPSKALREGAILLIFHTKMVVQLEANVHRISKTKNTPLENLPQGGKHTKQIDQNRRNGSNFKNQLTLFFP